VVKLCSVRGWRLMSRGRGQAAGDRVNVRVARNLTTTTIQSDVYAFVFDQSGLMGGIGIQGSKITRVNH
jgi:hypothetical protein